MSTILHVKRKSGKSPPRYLFLSSKRPKLDNNDKAADQIVVAKFAGLCSNLQENVEYIQTMVNVYKRNPVTKPYLRYPRARKCVLEKARQRMKENSAENRFKVINAQRSLGSSDMEKPENKKIKVIEVEDTLSLNKPDENATNENATTEEFQVHDIKYDLYYVETKEDINPESLSIYDIENQDMVYNEYRDKDYKRTIFDPVDSDESSAESYCDYPDTDPEDEWVDECNDPDITGNQLNSDLSSDEYDDITHINKSDLVKYDTLFANYKKKNLKEMGEISSSTDSSDSDCPDESQANLRLDN